MCGLAGIVGRIGARNRDALRKMNAAMLHRGPDADGFWEAEPDAQGVGAMLAHRRLSILDLSPAGAQPMVDGATGDVIAFNGEIYNYVQLRTELQSCGEALKSSGDTAVLLRSLGTQGNASIARLRGMFAFAFWNKRSRTLTLARDPLGIKPLYVAVNPDVDGEWQIAFASEVRALLASGLLGTPRLNPVAVNSLIWNGFTTAPETIVTGIQSLMPGEYVVLDGSGHEQERQQYWTAVRPPEFKAADESEVAAALEESVRLHLASDVPLGVFLSGGIDSSAVANLAQRASPGGVHTFTLAFEEKESNEGEFARQIARAIGTEHQEVMLTERFFLDNLEAAVECLDQPSFDGLNTYFMSRAVREAGFKVALVGAGGDELFGGYTSFRDLPSLLKWSRRTRWFGQTASSALARTALSIIDRGANQFPPQTRWAKLPSMLAAGDDLLLLYQLAYSLFLPETQQTLLGTEARRTWSTDGLPARQRERLRAEIENRSPLAAIGILEQRLFLGERLLRDSDAASMAASIEMRLPLVDSVLLSTVDRIAGDQRFGKIRSKSMLRRIGLRGLDPELFNRPKSGFELPYNRWLRSILGQKIEATFADDGQVAAAGLNPAAVRTLWSAFKGGSKGLYWTRIWSIYVLVRWCAAHRVSMQVAA